MPGHASREILVIFGSLTSCDPEDIYDTIKVISKGGFQIRDVSNRIGRRVAEWRDNLLDKELKVNAGKSKVMVGSSGGKIIVNS